MAMARLYLTVGRSQGTVSGVSLLAESVAIDGGTAVSAVLVASLIGAALTVRKWITDERDERVAGDHRLELMIAGLDKSDASDSVVRRGPT